MSADLNEWEFKHNFGGSGSTRQEEEIWLARKYAGLPNAASKPRKAGKIERPKRAVTRKKAVRKPSGIRKKPPGRRPKYDRPAIQKLYEAGDNVPSIAARVGAHEDTIRSILRELGIYKPNRDKSRKGSTGRPKKLKCHRGHDLTKEENLIWTKTKTEKPKRECRRCKYDRTNARRQNSTK